MFLPILYTVITTLLLAISSVLIYIVRRPKCKADIDGSNKYILVTGAAGGIGKEITLQLIKRGVFVFAADLNEASLNQCFSEQEAQGKVKTIQMDVTNPEQVKEAARKVEQLISDRVGGKDREQRLFGLINNAGIGLLHPLSSLVEKTDEKEMKQLFDINYFGVARTTTAFYPLLTKTRQPKEDASCIINIASIVGRFGHPFWSHYCATKHAVVGYSECLRREMSYLDKSSIDFVRVITVDPGITSTNILKLQKPSPTTKFREIIDQVKVAAEDPAIQFNDPAYVAERIVLASLTSNPPAHLQAEHLFVMRCLFYLASYAPTWMGDIAVDKAILRTPEIIRRNLFLRKFWHY